MNAIVRIRTWMMLPLLVPFVGCTTPPRPAVQLPADLPTVNTSFQLDNELADSGMRVFQRKGCGSCHSIGRGRMAAPDLLGVVERRTTDWLQEFLRNTDQMLGSDPIAQALLEEYRYIKMPNMGVTDTEIEALIHFLAAESQRARQGITD